MHIQDFISILLSNDGALLKQASLECLFFWVSFSGCLESSSSRLCLFPRRSFWINVGLQSCMICILASDMTLNTFQRNREFCFSGTSPCPPHFPSLKVIELLNLTLFKLKYVKDCVVRGGAWLLWWRWELYLIQNTIDSRHFVFHSFLSCQHQWYASKVATD